MKPNPRFHPHRKLCDVVAFVTFLCTTSLLAFEPNEWRQTQALNVPAASGLVRVNLPATTLDAAQPGLQDLRIVDTAGDQVPYLIERPAPEAESTLRPKELRSTIEGGTTRLVLETGTTGPIAGVSLETPASQFVKAVQVEGSHDGANWKKLAAGEPIFQLPGGAAKLRVSFPEGGWRFLRLTADDRRSDPVPFTGAQLHRPRSTAPAEAVSVRIKSRDESLGVTRLTLDLGASNLSLASLRIDTSEPLFTRSVTLAIPEIAEDGIQERTLGEAVVYRVDVDGKSEERLDIPVEQQIRPRELFLLIRNQDSPPLAINAVRGERRLVRLIFFAHQPGRYSLLSGNSQCAGPSYDLSALSEQLKNATATEVEPSPLAPNPKYKAPEALAALTLTGSKIDVAKWKFRKLVPLTQSGAQQIELHPDLLAHALPDQRDLRLVRERMADSILNGANIHIAPDPVERRAGQRSKNPHAFALVAQNAASSIADHAGCLHIWFTAFPSGNAGMGRSHGRARRQISARARSRHVGPNASESNARVYHSTQRTAAKRHAISRNQ